MLIYLAIDVSNVGTVSCPNLKTKYCIPSWSFNLKKSLYILLNKMHADARREHIVCTTCASKQFQPTSVRSFGSVTIHNL